MKRKINLQKRQKSSLSNFFKMWQNHTISQKEIRKIAWKKTSNRTERNGLE